MLIKGMDCRNTGAEKRSGPSTKGHIVEACESIVAFILPLYLNTRPPKARSVKTQQPCRLAKIRFVHWSYSPLRPGKSTSSLHPILLLPSLSSTTTTIASYPSVLSSAYYTALAPELPIHVSHQPSQRSPAPHPGASVPTANFGTTVYTSISHVPARSIQRILGFNSARLRLSTSQKHRARQL